MTQFTRIPLYLLFYFVSTALHAQTLEIEQLNFTPGIDGIAENDWSKLKNHSIEKINYGNISSEKDLSASFKIGWNEAHLFFLIRVKDDAMYAGSGSSIWKDDGIEIYIDAQNNKSSSYGANDFQFQMRYKDPQIYESKHNKTQGIQFAQKQSNDTLVYEMAIPFSTLGLSTVQSDQLLGFDIQVNDNDGTGAREGKKSWYGETEQASQSPAYFGTAKFVVPFTGPQMAAPIFSKSRGYYNAAFSLNITAASPDATVYYTLDGSNPKFSATRLSAKSPATISVNPASSANRGGITPGVIVRAVTKADGYAYSDVLTNTYLFTSQVIAQKSPGGNWNPPYNRMRWPGYDEPQVMDYNMDTKVTNASQYKNLMDDAFLQIPSYSIVTDYNDMFSENSGIFMNALEYGWERPVSLELIDPKNEGGFQIDAGIRIRGRYSRLPRNPKHSFRILFRSEYGKSKLTFPIFGEEGTDEFRRIDFRTAQNSSWNGENRPETVTFLKEVFARDLQGKMGMPYTKSRYCHLYLNGMYWGMYQIQERAEKYFAQTYLKGNKDDYDVIKPQKDVRNPENDLIVGASDGTVAPAKRLWDLSNKGFSSNEAYYKVQGMNPDGSRNYSFDRLLDMDNFIDYLLIAFYMGSEDGPVVVWEALWGQFVRPNNFIAIYNRKQPDGFKWFVHDFEKAMYNENDNWPLIEEDSWFSTNFNDFNPVKIHRDLLKNEEYRIKFADRIYRYFEYKNTFSPDSIAHMINQRKSQIDLAVIAESARWGDWFNSNKAQTKANWEDNVNWLTNTYVPKRTDIVLEQFRGLGVLSDLNPPLILKGDKQVHEDAITLATHDEITLNNTNGKGQIYYTINGADPRAIGGTIASGASTATKTKSLNFNTTTALKARTKNGNTWSPLTEITVNVSESIQDLRFTELHYHPKDKGLENSDGFEFIELKNVGTSTVNLTGVSFTKGIEYTFESGSIAPQGFVVLASNSANFANTYGVEPTGQYVGQLKNSGEAIELSNASRTDFISFTYNDKMPWPLASDGLGNSLVPTQINPDQNPDVSTYWKASSLQGGSPFADDPEPHIPPILINEVLANTSYPLVDAIELFNPTDSAVNVGYWYLTDNRNQADKWMIPPNTIIPAQSYITLKQGYYEDEVLIFDGRGFGNFFSISSHGEEVFLFSGYTNFELTGYSTGVEFEASQAGVSFGKHTNSLQQMFFVAQQYNSLGDFNAYPKVGPIIFDEIMYHPPLNGIEYVKLKNTSNRTVVLFATDNRANTWKIEGIDFTFPMGVMLGAGDSLYVIEREISADVFRHKAGLDNSVQIFNMQGSLDNSGETIALYKPSLEYTNGNEVKHAYILQEAVTYDDGYPWLTSADGLGASLHRVDEQMFANDPTAWSHELLTPPTLLADENKAPGDNVVLTFVSAPDWQAKINAVYVNDIKLKTGEFTVTNGNIDIKGKYFTRVAMHHIRIDADQYASAEVQQSIIPGTAVDDMASPVAMQAYPNPTSGNLNLLSHETHVERNIIVSDLTGKIILKTTWAKGQVLTQINLKQSGIYLVQVNTATQQTVFKVIKE